MNGVIQARIVSEGSKNQYGELIPGTVKAYWDSEEECSYVPITSNTKGVYVDGEFIKTSYTITLENMDFRSETIRLKDSRGNILCEKEVLSLDVLEEVQRVKIMV